MFKSIQITNFKGLSKLKIDDASLVNLIAGKNNVGKTSVLEALCLYLDWLNPASIIKIHGRRGFPLFSDTQDMMWGPIFSDYDLQKPIEIALEDNSGKTSNLRINLNKSYTRPVNQSVAFSPLNSQPVNANAFNSTVVALDMTYAQNGKNALVIHQVIEGNNVTTYRDNDIFNFKQIEAYFMSAGSRTPFQEDAIKFGKLDVKGKVDQLVNLMKETIEPRLIDLSSVALESQSVIHAKLQGIERKIPVSFMGDGMARLISIILAISNCENGCVFIDEIENGIHYSVFPKIWNGIIRAAEEYNCQVFATTHSYECLESAVNGIETGSQDHFRYIRLDRDNNKIISNTYSFAALSTSIAHEWEVR